ncbi:hypothetical protein KY362_00005 [Candidatus Woesearchaeota archaeon]|nr:hypothetical protein [Candidatus Woesearchaeota archaeon]
MSKRGNVRTALLFLLVAFLIVIAAASFMANFGRIQESEITGQTITVANRDNAVRMHESLTSVPNPDEGTIVIWTKPPMKIFGQFDDSHQYIIFFTAENIPGLRVAYNMKTSSFEAGTPLLRTPPVDIFDEAPHQFVYTYKAGGEQAIFLDGQKVSESAFSPMQITKVTGFMIKDFSDILRIDIDGLEISVYDRAISAEDLGKI